MALNAVGGDHSKLKLFPPELVKKCSKDYTSAEMLDKYAVRHFYSWWNWYLKEEPDVFT